MSSSKKLLPGLLLAGFLTSCEPPAVEPELTIAASPRTVDGLAQKATLKFTATDEKGKLGTGKVRVTSTAGSLKDGVEVDLVGGEGSTDFLCTRATDIACTGVVRLNAEWVVRGKLTTATTSVTVTPPVVIVPDAGVTLTASRARLGIGLGNTADIVGTYAVNGIAQADASVTLTTSEGLLLLTDGGPFASPAATDSLGQVHAVLAENGTPGTANLNASGPTGRTGNVSVVIYTPDAGITIATDRTVLTLGFGELALLTVNHTLEGRAVPGRPLTLETTAGRLLELDGGNFVSPSPTDLNGRVRAYLTDTGSPGAATITARDPSATVQASVIVALSPPDAGVVVSSSRQAIYLGINDFANIQASLYANGNPSPNRALNVSTTVGALSLPDAGAFNGMGTTDSNGALNLVLRDTGTPGNAVITATDPNSGRTGSTPVSVRQISTINFTQMVCSGMPCTVLGVGNSNFRTAGKLQFVVRDNQATPQPVAGVNVTFTINLSSASGTTIAPTQTVTDINGLAEVIVNTGNAVGSFTVTATVIPGVAASSPSFGVRGAKPTNRGFTLQCNRTTMSAYTAPLPPLPITITCTVSVVDRNNNPVGLATDVSLRPEVGTMAQSVQTPEFTAAASANEGKANVDFSTVGDFPAADVAPLAANPSQYPYALAAEPQRNDSLIVRNPRDGLVVIVAWTRGEEWFNDLDGNGVQNGNEPFVDQGEPFLDTNDNDVFDGTDLFFNVDGDNVYTPPNGVWDANTFVWTKTYVLYTDRSYPPLTSFSPSSFNVAKDSMQTVFVTMPDLNLNRIEAGSSVDFVRTASKGSILSNFFNLGLDGFGFDFDPRILTNVAGTAACPTATDRICVFKTRFGQWGRGAVGSFIITGAPGADVTPPQTDNITVRATTRGGTVLSPPITGTIQ